MYNNSITLQEASAYPISIYLYLLYRYLSISISRLLCPSLSEPTSSYPLTPHTPSCAVQPMKVPVHISASYVRAVDEALRAAPSGLLHCLYLSV